MVSYGEVGSYFGDVETIWVRRSNSNKTRVYKILQNMHTKLKKGGGGVFSRKFPRISKFKLSFLKELRPHFRQPVHRDANGNQKSNLDHKKKVMNLSERRKCLRFPFFSHWLKCVINWKVHCSGFIKANFAIWSHLGEMQQILNTSENIRFHRKFEKN